MADRRGIGDRPGVLRPAANSGLKMKMSGRCIPPSYGSLLIRMSPSAMSSPKCRSTAWSATGIEQRCPGSGEALRGKPPLRVAQRGAVVHDVLQHARIGGAVDRQHHLVAECGDGVAEQFFGDRIGRVHGGIGPPMPALGNGLHHGGALADPPEQSGSGHADSFARSAAAVARRMRRVSRAPRARRHVDRTGDLGALGAAGADPARGAAAPSDGTAAGGHARRQQADHRAGADRADRQQGVLRPAGGGGKPAAHRQHLRAACGRQGGDRLERELRQHDRRVAAMGARYRSGGGGRHRRGVRDRHLQHQHRRDRGVAYAGRRGWRVRHGGDPRCGRRVPGRGPVPRQPGGRQDRSAAADRPARWTRWPATRSPASMWRCRW